MSGPLVVLGIGNVLLRDDGAGVHALARLDPGTLPAGTRIVDGGTGGTDLVHEIAGARAVVVIDATVGGGNAGAVRLLREDAIREAGSRRAGSAGGVGDIMASARLTGACTGPIALVGIEAARIEAGTGCTPLVEAALPDAVEAVRSLAWTLDRETNEAPSHSATEAAIAPRLPGVIA